VVGRSVLVGVTAIALVLAAVWLAQRKLIYFPDPTTVPSAARVLPGARDVVLSTADGLRLGGWVVPPSGNDRRQAVLITAGNGGHRLGRAPLAAALAAAGFTVLLFDYRGYGGNPGDPTERGLALDAEAALRELTDVQGFPAGRVVYFGESLGAAVAANLAVGHPPAGLVLRSPFVDLATVGRHHYPVLPVRLLLRDRFPVAGLLGRVTAPTVVVYGTADSIVPPAQSRTVADRAGGPVRVVVIDGADHNDPALVDGPEVIDAVAGLPR
jgi:hypothetical protein